jgi:hypothetical protein
MTTITLNEQERESILHALSIAVDDYYFDNEEDKAQVAMRLWLKITKQEREGK